jgi:hypothetical protein
VASEEESVPNSPHLVKDHDKKPDKPCPEFPLLPCFLAGGFVLAPLRALRGVGMTSRMAPTSYFCGNRLVAGVDVLWDGWSCDVGKLDATGSGRLKPAKMLLMVTGWSNSASRKTPTRQSRAHSAIVRAHE